jgi:hypothetical protein
MTRTRLALVFILALTWIGLAGTVEAQSRVVSRGKVTGPTALVRFESTDGCMLFEGIVFAEQDVRSGLTAGVTAAIVDTCTGTDIALNYGTTTVADFTVRPNLAGAMLHALIPVTDLKSGATATMQVDVNWMASGPIDRMHNAYRYEEGGLTITAHSVQWTRPASATGMITDGTTVFASSGSSDAFSLLLWTNYGEVLLSLPG